MTNLLLGPTGRLSPGIASDSNSGVGGSHASCTWDGSTWFQSTPGASYAPSTTSGSVESFTFACRSVDLLGNQGPITWVNGSVDLETPDLSLQPAASETIGLNSSLVVNVTDSNGISSTQLALQWSNGTSTLYSNLSLGTSNWSSTLGQLFTGLSDGTVTATVTTTDQLGNSNTIAGRSWTLNTSNPFISTSLSGTYYDQFISNNSTGISLTLPSGGWSGLWVAYTFVDSTGTTILSGNISSSILLEPVDLVEGSAWLNTTTGDSLGRIQVQSWIYSVDNSNSETPILMHHGMNVTVGNTTWVSGSTYFTVGSINDAAGGVGSDFALCSWDNQTWFSVVHSDQIYPTVSSGSLESFSLTCKNIDRLGNSGLSVDLNVNMDTISPEQSLSPSSGNYIIQNSSITIDTSDNLNVEDRLYLVWSDGTSSRFANVTINSTPRAIILNQVWTGLADGEVQATLYSRDQVGNENQTSTRTWILNTSLPVTNVLLQGNFVQNYVAAENFTIQITPPAVGSLNGWSIYSLEHSNGTIIVSGNISNLTTISFCQECTINYLLQYGSLFLNITSFDPFGRSQANAWIYVVDSGVGTVPSYSVLGSSLTQGTSVVLGLNSSIQIGTLQDDVGGVGPSHARCTLNGNSLFNVTTASQIHPNSSTGSVSSYSLGCSVVDQLGHVGSMSWFNGSIDAQSPLVNFSIMNNAAVSQNTVLAVSCLDSNGCEMNSIQVKYQYGTNVTWYSMSLSGATASVQFSSILNVTQSGYLEVYVTVIDGVSNSVNASLSGLLYLHDTPTLTTQISSNHSGSYVNENVSLRFVPSSGWVVGLDVNVSISHSNYTSSFFAGTINQSTSEKSFSNLVEGTIWVNTTICDALNRCSNSTAQLLVDQNGPGQVNISGPTIHYLSNGSIIMNPAQSIQINGGSDQKSGLSSTRCSGENSFVVFSSSSYSMGIQSLVPTGSWKSIACYSVDKVGNIGPTTSYTLFLDNQLPIMNVSYGQSIGVITPSKWFDGSCEDNVFLVSSQIEIWSDNNLIYQNNGTGNHLIRYGGIASLNSTKNVSIFFTCLDAAGNENTSQQTIEYVASLEATNPSVGGVVRDSDMYITNTTILTLQNSRNDVSHTYRYIVNGSTGSWFYTNSTIIQMDLASIPDSSIVRIQVGAYLSGSNLSNLSMSNSFIVDHLGPALELQSNNPIANGTALDLSSIDSGVGVASFTWSWDNGTLQESTSLSSIILPSSISNSSWLELIAFDALGHSSATLFSEISRDLTPPEVTVNSSHGSFYGPNSVLQVTLADDTGIASSSVIVYANQNQTYLVASNVTNSMLSSTNAPSWIWNYSLVEIKINVVSNSGHTVTSSFFISPDNQAPNLEISFSESKNMSGFNSSNFSEIHFLEPSDLKVLCVKVGATQAQAQAETCLTFSDNFVRVLRASGVYVLLVNGTDFAGNNRLLTLNINHHSENPVITFPSSSIIRPGANHSFMVNSLFPYQLEVFWNNISLATNQNYFIVPSGSGNHQLSVHSTNELGLSAVLNRTMILDGVHPAMSLELDLFGGSHFGTNSTLFVNVSDEVSMISNITIFLNHSSSSCSKSFTPLNRNFSMNGTLSDLMSSTPCSNLQDSNLAVTIEIFSSDITGNYATQTYSFNYHGSLVSPAWSSNNSVMDINFIWSSHLSTHTCIAAAGAILPSYELSWSGLSSSIQGNQITNLSNDGIAVCTVVDWFGNSATTSLNITLDATSPEYTVIWPTGSYEPYVRYNTGHFTINGYDNSTSIRSIAYCISVSSCTPSTPTNGTISTLPSSGQHILHFILTNNVGLETTHNLTFVVDGALPMVLIEGETNTSVSTSTIYIGRINPALRVLLQDSDCILGGTAYWEGGSISLSTNSTISVPLNRSWLRIEAVDCVGHLTTNNYSIQRVYSISPGTVAAHYAHAHTVVQNGSAIIHDGSVQFLVNATHPVELTLECTSSAGVTCDVNDPTSPFLITINSTSASAYIWLVLSDDLGNSQAQQLNLTADIEFGYCSSLDDVYIDGEDIFLPGNRSSTYLCDDDLSGLESIFWKQGSTIVMWNDVGNNTWRAPGVSGSQVELVIVDRVGNNWSQLYNLTLDNSAPIISMNPLNGKISFNESISRSDGQFYVECSDSLIPNCELNVSIIDLTTGEELLSMIQYNRINITMPLPSPNTTIRIEISANDALNNQDYVSVVLLIDDNVPTFDLASYSSSNDLLEPYIASHDGSLRLLNVPSDANYSLSDDIFVRCIESGQFIKIPFRSNIMLSEFELWGCEEITITANLSDHVGNLFERSKTYFLDQQTPSVTYAPDPNCSIAFGNIIDITSNCQINIAIDDDGSSLLQGNYTLAVRSQNGSILSEVIIGGLSANHRLIGYNGETVIVNVVGYDKVGNIVASNPLTLSVSDEINPIWKGVICSQNRACDLTGDVILAPTGDDISIITPQYRANISSIKLEFRSANSEFNLHSSVFSSSQIPDGAYLLSVQITDEVGRNYTSVSTQFVYDTNAPVIEVLQVASVGILDEDTILSCETCVLVWRIKDLTNTSLITNHGTENFNSLQYSMTTNLLGNNIINITAMDAFGRTSKISFATVSILNTRVDPVNNHIEYSDVDVQCLEMEPKGGSRQITCLWTRKTPTISEIPIALEIEIDLENLREVQLITKKPGASPTVMDIQSGSMTLPNIYQYDKNFEIVLSDQFSQINSLEITLVERISAWGGVGFVTTNISENDLSSQVEIFLEPPAEIGSFLLLERGYANIEEFISCSSNYNFKQVAGPDVQVESQNCDVLSDGDVSFLPNGSLVFSVLIDHAEVRNFEGSPLKAHPAPLFNLETFEILLNYQDYMDLEMVTAKGDLVFNSESISRTEDLEPYFVGKNGSKCPLSFATNNGQVTDGFLQSQYSSPLSECLGIIVDDDGIMRTIWQFTFIAGESNTEVEISCLETYFPVDWDFESAIDRGSCSAPSRSLPDGVFDVVIMPLIVDERVFSRDLTPSFSSNNKDSGVPVIESCEVLLECKTLEFRLTSVTVSSNLNPAKEVQNTKNLIQTAQNMNNSFAFIILMWLSIIGLIGSFIILERMIRSKRNQSLSDDKDSNQTESLPEQHFGYKLEKLEKIVMQYKIQDVEAFLDFAKTFDVNHDNYLSGIELVQAAEQYQNETTEQGIESTDSETKEL